MNRERYPSYLTPETNNCKHALMLYYFSKMLLEPKNSEYGPIPRFQKTLSRVSTSNLLQIEPFYRFLSNFGFFACFPRVDLETVTF